MDAFLHDGKNYILHFSFMLKVGDTDLSHKRRGLGAVL